MVRLFSGEDIYASYQAALQTAAELAQKLGLEVKVIDADEYSAQKLWDSLQQVGLFSQNSVQIWKRALDAKDVAEMLGKRLEELQNMGEIIVWQPGSVDGRSAFAKKLTAAKQHKVFEAPKQWEAAAWLKAEVANQKLLLSESQQRWIIERIGLDKLQIRSELQKIGLFIQANSKITQADLEALIPETAEQQVWNVLDSLSLGSKAESLRLLDKFADGDNLQYLLTMLSRELTLLSKVAYVKQQGLSPMSLGLRDFVLQKAQKKLTKFNLAKLRKLSLALFRLDVAIKRGKIEPETGLFLLAMAW